MLVRTVGIFAWVLFGLAIALAGLSSRNPRPRPAGTDDVRMPALSLEFADSDEALYRIIGRPGDPDPAVAELRRWFKRNIKGDYVFIVLYWLLFAGIAGVLAQRGAGWPLWVAGAAIVAATGAAAFDVVENMRMLRAIETVRLAGNDMATAGFLKWFFSFVALALLSVTFFWRGGWVWIAGAASLLIAGIGLAGLIAIRAGGRQVWPIGLAFTAMMLVLLPLVAGAFTFGRAAFPDSRADPTRVGLPAGDASRPPASVPGD